MIKKFKLEWISSIDPENNNKLNHLSAKMSDYYTNNLIYYDDISDSEYLWNDKNYLPHMQIIASAGNADKILEIGCGESSILKHHPEISHKYSGIDFSPKIIEKNQKRFPGAGFSSIEDPLAYPYPDASFDLIFSVFVLEHTVFPQKFLNECIRLLKDGGEIIILAPNYLDNGFLPSQQVSEGLLSGRELLKKGRLLEAIRAAWYNKILIPNECKKLRRNIPGFYINTNPICFKIKEFEPDVDAVYVVSEKEIEVYMKQKGFNKVENSSDLAQFTQSRKLCFHIFKK